MVLDPESLRHMSPGQMFSAILVDAVETRHTQARAVGAKCVVCLDTGMTSDGKFCVCSAGAKVSYQANKPQS